MEVHRAGRVDGGEVAAASCSTVYGMFAARVRQHPERIAVEDLGPAGTPSSASRRLSYRELHERVGKLGAALSAAGVARGDRIALLSENRAEYLEVFLAAAKLGASVACQNWRLTKT